MQPGIEITGKKKKKKTLILFKKRDNSEDGINFPDRILVYITTRYLFDIQFLNHEHDLVSLY